MHILISGLEPPSDDLPDLLTFLKDITTGLSLRYAAGSVHAILDTDNLDAFETALDVLGMQPETGVLVRVLMAPEDTF